MEQAGIKEMTFWFFSDKTIILKKKSGAFNTALIATFFCKLSPLGLLYRQGDMILKNILKF